MGNQWYRRDENGREIGPLSRHDLASMAQSGELDQDDMVRTRESTLWIRARHVKDLFRPANSGDLPQSAYEAELAKIRSGRRRIGRDDRQDRLPWWQRPAGWELVAVVAIVAAAASYMSWVTPENARFPLPSHLQAQVPERHFFFGTGPWSLLEYALLWFDSALLLGGWAFWRLGGLHRNSAE